MVSRRAQKWDTELESKQKVIQRLISHSKSKMWESVAKWHSSQGFVVFQEKKKGSRLSLNHIYSSILFFGGYVTNTFEVQTNSQLRDISSEVSFSFRSFLSFFYANNIFCLPTKAFHFAIYCDFFHSSLHTLVQRHESDPFAHEGLFFIRCLL